MRVLSQVSDFVSVDAELLLALIQMPQIFGGPLEGEPKIVIGEGIDLALEFSSGGDEADKFMADEQRLGVAVLQHHAFPLEQIVLAPKQLLVIVSELRVHGLKQVEVVEGQILPDALLEQALDLEHAFGHAEGVPFLEDYG